MVRGSAETCCCPNADCGHITLCTALMAALTITVSAAVLLYTYKLLGFDVWLAGAKGAGVYCLVKFLFKG